MRRETFAVLCADEDHEDLARLRDALDRITGDACLVEGFRNGGRLAGRIRQLGEEGVPVPVVFVDETLMDGPGTEAMLSLHQSEPGSRVRKVLVTRDTEDAGVRAAIRAGALDGTIAKPWTDQQLRGPLTRLVTEHFVTEDPGMLERVPGLVDVGRLAHAYTVEQQRGQATRDQLKELQSSFFADDGMTDDEVEQAMIDEIDRVLGHPERQLYPSGSSLLRSGDPVTGIQIVLHGRVRLFRVVDGEEVVFHSRTAGRIIGLLAMARTQPAFFSCIAETDVEVIPLSFAQLSDALHRSPTLAVHFVSVLIRSLARRNLRSVELQLERDRLARDLETDRDRLAAALQRLEQAQTRLIESEKMATLGQLVAGIGHELNNPVTAIGRAAEFLERDVPRIVAAHPRAEILTETLAAAQGSEPRSTREERRLRRDLAADLGDDGLAARLVAVGITSATQYRQVFAATDPERREHLLREIETHHQVGLALHSIRSATDRIAALVKGLRSYARAGAEGVTATDVREGLEETLVLLGGALEGIEVERDYGDVPLIQAYPGDLNQVWTNLISNAVQAMEGEGRLEIHTVHLPAEDSVRVDVVDSGPGIAAEDVERIFDLHFTTKGGRVEFGLGLGLRIAQDVVRRHGGDIEVESRPGRTRFGVVLPVQGTPRPAPGIVGDTEEPQ